MIKLSAKSRKELRDAFQNGRLTLYLGAGVSVANGLPTWQRLVLSMYFDMLSDTNHRAYSNYLHAVAEWMLQKSPDPLEITAQKIRIHYGNNENAFLDNLKRQLYAGYYFRNKYQVPTRQKLCAANSTLSAVADLIDRSSSRKKRGVETVITYNYDNFLEISLKKNTRFHVVNNAGKDSDSGIPVYHVHGYVPINSEKNISESSIDDIIFTEEQYHDATNTAYSWSNLVQIKGLSGSTGLMVGLSLSDRNIRRILHALSQSPVPAKCYAILQRPTWRKPYDHEEQEVHDMATRLYKLARESGSPVPPNYGIKGKDWRSQVRDILDRTQSVATSQQEKVLSGLGIIPIWYDDHKEVGGIVRRLL